MLKLGFAQKVSLINTITNEIISDSEKKYRKLKDLMMFTEDPKDVDIVLKSIEALGKVFLEIIPAYRIREDLSKEKVDDEAGAKKGMKLSKDVLKLRDYESFMLESYKGYLAVLA